MAILATCILIGGGGFAFGYTASRRLGFNIRDARTISLETGIQNGPLAIVIVGAALPACAKGQSFSLCAQKQALLFPYIYSIFIVLQSVIVTTQVYMKQAVEPPPIIPEKRVSLLVGTTATVMRRANADGHTYRRSRIAARGARWRNLRSHR